jgi:hypothetical protein
MEEIDRIPKKKEKMTVAVVVVAKQHIYILLPNVLQYRYNGYWEQYTSTARPSVCARVRPSDHKSILPDYNCNIKRNQKACIFASKKACIFVTITPKDATKTQQKRIQNTTKMHAKMLHYLTIIAT